MGKTRPIASEVEQYFTDPSHTGHRQYLAMRCFLHDKESAQSVAERFGYDNYDMPDIASISVSDDDENEPAPIVRAKRTKIEEPLTIRKTTMPAPGLNKSKPDAPKKSTPVNGIDTSGVQVGTKLRHKAFGQGVVHSLDTQHISVEFNGARKKFKFPAAILEGFLEIV